MYFHKNLEKTEQYFFKDAQSFITRSELYELFEQCIAYSYQGIEDIGFCQGLYHESGFSPKISIYSFQMKEIFRNEEISEFDWIRSKSKESILNFLKQEKKVLQIT